MRQRKSKKMTRAGATGSKVKQYRGTQANNTIVSSLAKETGGSLVAGSGRTCFNKEGRENKCSHSIPKSVGKVYIMQLIYHRCGQREWELLQLWRFWIFGKELQKKRNRR